MRHELLSVSSVLAIPVALFLAFPRDAIRFDAVSVPSACAPSAAFVVLTPEQESAALIAAKTTWQTDAEARQRQRIRLPLGDLPEEPLRPLLDVGAGARPVDVPAPLAYSPRGWEPSLRSSTPERLPPESGTRPPLAFSREDLLKMN